MYLQNKERATQKTPHQGLLSFTGRGFEIIATLIPVKRIVRKAGSPKV